jgi:hypothetical protein
MSKNETATTNTVSKTAKTPLSNLISSLNPIPYARSVQLTVFVRKQSNRIIGPHIKNDDPIEKQVSRKGAWDADHKSQNRLKYKPIRA